MIQEERPIIFAGVPRIKRPPRALGELAVSSRGSKRRQPSSEKNGPTPASDASGVGPGDAMRPLNSIGRASSFNHSWQQVPETLQQVGAASPADVDVNVVADASTTSHAPQSQVAQSHTSQSQTSQVHSPQSQPSQPQTPGSQTSQTHRSQSQPIGAVVAAVAVALAALVPRTKKPAPITRARAAKIINERNIRNSFNGKCQNGEIKRRGIAGRKPLDSNVSFQPTTQSGARFRRRL